MDQTKQKNIEFSATNTSTSNSPLQNNYNAVIPFNQTWLHQGYQQFGILIDPNEPNKFYCCPSLVIPTLTNNEIQNYQITQMQIQDSDKNNIQETSTSTKVESDQSSNSKSKVKKTNSVKNKSLNTTVDTPKQDNPPSLDAENSIQLFLSEFFDQNKEENEILETINSFYNDKVCIVKLDFTNQKILGYSKNIDINVNILTELLRFENDNYFLTSSQSPGISSNNDGKPEKLTFKSYETFPQNLVSSSFDKNNQSLFKNNESMDVIVFKQLIESYNKNIGSSNKNYFRDNEIFIEIQMFGKIEISKIINKLEEDYLVRFVELFLRLTDQTQENCNFIDHDNKDSLSETMENFEDFFKNFIFSFSHCHFDDYIKHFKKRYMKFIYPCCSNKENIMAEILHDFNVYYKEYIHYNSPIFNNNNVNYLKDLDHFFSSQPKNKIIEFLNGFLENKSNPILLDLYPELVFFFEYLEEIRMSIPVCKFIHVFYSLLFFKLNLMKGFLREEFILKNPDDNFTLTDSKFFNCLDLDISYLILYFCSNFLVKEVHIKHLLYKTFLKFIKLNHPRVYNCFLENEFCYGNLSLNFTLSIKIEAKKFLSRWSIEDKKNVYKIYEIDKIKKWVKFRIANESTVQDDQGQEDDFALSKHYKDSELIDLREINLFILKDLTKKMRDFLMTE